MPQKRSPLGTSSLHKTFPKPWPIQHHNDNSLKVLACKKLGLRRIQLDIVVVYRPLSQLFNLDDILIEKLTAVTQATYLFLIGGLNAPNANLKCMTTSNHESKFDARLLSFCFDKFLVSHFLLATWSVLGQKGVLS